MTDPAEQGNRSYIKQNGHRPRKETNMGYFDNVENISKGIDSLTEKVGEVKDNTDGILKNQEKTIKLSREGEKMMNADAYALGKISLEELIKREREADFNMTKEEFNKLSLQEQQKIFEEHPERIRQMLGE